MEGTSIKHVISLLERLLDMTELRLLVSSKKRGIRQCYSCARHGGVFGSGAISFLATFTTRQLHPHLPTEYESVCAAWADTSKKTLPGIEL
jgi:hypothetical protein